MIETPTDLFDEWHSLPLSKQSRDDRFVVRRAHVADYEAIYDCVDEAFGRKRPRALFNWLYRENPFGLARAWILEEVATSRILKTGVYYPWPIWRDDKALQGSLSGDAATVPDWQRKGLSAIRREVRRSHPWSRQIASIAGPNESSNTVTTKAGEGSSILGLLPGGVAVLRAAPLAKRVGLPSLVAKPVGALASLFLDTWQRAALSSGKRALGTNGTLRFEPIGRFDSTFDRVTLETMRFPWYWSPHNADFLNWRYLDHPIESYVAFALIRNDRPIAYSVIRVARDEATLAEFASAPEYATALMAGTLAQVRSAGCPYVTFFAPPTWRHWRAFKRVGFLPYQTNNYLDAVYYPEKEESEQMNHWQLTPGDRDYH